MECTRAVRLAATFACIALCWFAAGSGRGDQAAPIVPNEVLVGISPDPVNPPDTRIEQLVGTIVGRETRIHAYRIRLRPGLSVQNAIIRLRDSGLVTYAEPNHIVLAAATPNDTHYAARQYGPQITQANRAWDIWTPAGQAVIAIIDTGIDGTHPDLTNKMYRVGGVIKGYNSLTGQEGPGADDNGHGTHVAGISAGEINNNTGIAGIAGWNPAINGSGTAAVRLMPVKVLDSGGGGTDASVAAGITWAADNGARVLNLSLGSPSTSQTLSNAVDYAWGKGCVIVAAAGNSGVNQLFYPAAYANVLAVGATDSLDQMTSFSNWGSWVSLVAPGNSIYSTILGGGYTYLSGTSMACPHVAGAAILMISQNLILTNSQTRTLLINNTDPYTYYPGHSPGSSGGRLNVFRALQAAGNGGPPSAPANLVAGRGNSQVGLKWDTAFGAASYTVKRSTTQGGPYTNVATGVATTTYIDTTVTNGTRYYYVVTAVNLAGESPNSNEAAVTPVYGFWINSAGSQYISASALWQADAYYTGGIAYQFAPRTITNTNDPTLYLSERYSPDFSYTVPAVNGTYTVNLECAELVATQAGQRRFNVTLNGVQVLTNHDIFATTGGQNIANVQSFPVTVTTGSLSIVFHGTTGDAKINAIEVVQSAPGPPPAPTNLTATPGDGQVTLAWLASPGATSYTVKRATTNGGPYTNIATGVTVLSYVNTGLTNGTTYYYVVSASNGNGESPNSNQASATPTNLVTVKINTGGPQYVSPTTGTWAADTYYTGGTAYQFSPRTITNTNDPTLYLSERYGQSFSYALPATNGSYTLNLYFAELVATQAGQRVFNVSANGSQIITNLDIFAAAGGQNIAIVRSFPVTVTNGSVSLQFTGAGGDAKINAIELVPANPVPPPAPTNLTATPGNQQISLSWSGSPNATSYNVKRSTTNGGPYTTIASPVATTYTDTGLTNGTTYYYVVTAVNGQGESPNSNQASATPTNATSTKINTGGPQYVSLTTGTWVADTYYTGGTAYQFAPRSIANTADPTLFLSERYGPSFSYSIPATNGSYTLNLYFAELVATQAGQRLFNISVNGTQVASNFDIFAAAGGQNIAIVRSFPVSVTTGTLTIQFTGVGGDAKINAIELVPGAPVAPPAPTNLTATAGNAQVSLAWAGSANATSYNVKRSTTNGGPYTTIGSPVTTSYTDTTVTNGTTYYYVVTAVNGAGESGNSNQASATPTNLTTLRINTGGPQYVSPTTGTWIADTYYSGGIAYQFSPRTITGTADPTLFLSERYSPSFSYSLPASNGSYTLDLYFAELVATQAGQRKFNVTVNGTQVLTNLDIFAAAGGQNIAIVRSFPVTVTTGTVTIQFTGTVGDAKINAIGLHP